MFAETGALAAVAAMVAGCGDGPTRGSGDLAFMVMVAEVRP
jgi:hypothetical protein